MAVEKTTAARMALKPLYQARNKSHYYWWAAISWPSALRPDQSLIFGGTVLRQWIHFLSHTSIQFHRLCILLLDCQSLLIFRCTSRWPICCHLGCLSGVYWLSLVDLIWTRAVYVKSSTDLYFDQMSQSLCSTCRSINFRKYSYESRFRAIRLGSWRGISNRDGCLFCSLVRDAILSNGHRPSSKTIIKLSNRKSWKCCTSFNE